MEPLETPEGMLSFTEDINVCRWAIGLQGGRWHFAKDCNVCRRAIAPHEARWRFTKDIGVCALLTYFLEKNSLRKKLSLPMLIHDNVISSFRASVGQELEPASKGQIF
ncbi:hypothetical protein PoB_007587500 [Plakobranchus ocellatus]|uniref:Uncharacterized protein n=1 Tax=Plakobranchus ocellatus TaxID=259542 RepID=A0AAV4DZC2_9GAST|nr:hypothetical protein PoB_007587500 [Plakobranchus ocellatus]